MRSDIINPLSVRLTTLSFKKKLIGNADAFYFFTVFGRAHFFKDLDEVGFTKVSVFVIDQRKRPIH